MNSAFPPCSKFLIPLATALLGAHSLIAAPGDLAAGWPVATDGIIFGAPAIGPHGEVVIGSEDSQVYSYNPDGSLRWVFAGCQDWVDCSPTIAADGTVYVGSWDNSLYAIEGETGALKWEFVTGSIIIASPAIGADGTVYVGSYDGLLYALNPDGSLRWTFQPWTILNLNSQRVADGSPVTASPILNSTGDTLYFGTENGNFYAVSTADGSRRWYFPVVHPGASKQINGSPAIGQDGTLYFTSENGYLYSVKGTGALNWWFQASESIKSGPVINGSGAVSFAGQDGYLYAVDAEGFQLWETFVGDVFYCSPAIDANGNLVIGAYAGSSVIGAATAFTSVDSLGIIRWEHIIYGYNDSSPNIAPDGSIYIGAHDGFLYKLQGGAGLSKSGWPRHQGNRRQTGRGADLQAMELIDYFPAAKVAENGWIHVPWFGTGWLTGSQLPWVQHLDHGFIYVLGPTTGSVYFYDSALSEWFYAPAAAPSYYYRFTTGNWLYHWAGTTVGTGRWFYDYATAQWYPEADLK